MPPRTCSFTTFGLSPVSWGFLSSDEDTAVQSTRAASTRATEMGRMSYTSADIVSREPFGQLPRLDDRHRTTKFSSGAGWEDCMPGKAEMPAPSAATDLFGAYRDFLLHCHQARGRTAPGNLPAPPARMMVCSVISFARIGGLINAAAPTTRAAIPSSPSNRISTALWLRSSRSQPHVR